jgi:ATP-dependent Lon protease
MRLPTVVPVVTLPNVILFPQAMLPLHIFEPRHRRLLADALASDRMLSLAMQKPGRTRESPAAIAGLGLIRACVRNKNGTANLILQGIARVELTRTVRYRPYRVCRIRLLPPAAGASVAIHALADKVLELVRERLDLGLDLPFKALEKPLPPGTQETDEPVALRAFRHVLLKLTKLEAPEQLADLVSATLLPKPEQRQVILETQDLEARLRCLVRFLIGEIKRQKPNPAA